MKKIQNMPSLDQQMILASIFEKFAEAVMKQCWALLTFF